jgi:SRP54-type protein, helical bundle domain
MRAEQQLNLLSCAMLTVLVVLCMWVSFALRPVVLRNRCSKVVELVNVHAYPQLQADVNVKLVMGLRSNVKKRVNIADVPAGLNVRRLIEKAVYDEMVSMLDRCASQQGHCGLSGNLQTDWKEIFGRQQPGLGGTY